MVNTGGSHYVAIRKEDSELFYVDSIGSQRYRLQEALQTKLKGNIHYFPVYSNNNKTINSLSETCNKADVDGEFTKQLTNSEIHAKLLLLISFLEKKKESGELNIKPDQFDRLIIQLNLINELFRYNLYSDDRIKNQINRKISLVDRTIKINGDKPSVTDLSWLYELLKDIIKDLQNESYLPKDTSKYKNTLLTDSKICNSRWKTYFL